MLRCITCKRRIWPWQKTGFNSSWHKDCTKSWQDGYDTASRFAEEENRMAGYKGPFDLYWERMRELWRHSKFAQTLDEF